MHTDDWSSLYVELKKANTGRNLDCWALANAYAGNLWNLFGQPVNRDQSGRIILRNTNREGSAKRGGPLVVNHLKGIVDDYVALLSTLPDVKVPPPGSSDADQQFADRVERFHYGVWHASYLAIQMKAVAWWDSVMGSTAGIVWPDFKRRHPVFRFAAPYMLYSVPDDVEPFMLSKAIIAERFPARAVRETYPEIKQRSNMDFAYTMTGSQSQSYMTPSATSSANSLDGSIEVVKCFDKNEVVTIIYGQRVRSSRHDMGFCPVVEIPNILVPGTRGESDIAQVVGLAQHASFIAQAYEEYVLQDIYSPIVVEGLMEGKVPEDINPLNPNEIIPVNIGGKVSRLGAGQGSTVVGQELTRTQGMIEYMTGVPQVRMEGSMKSSITTGRGIDRAQGPYFSRTQYRTDILGFYLEQMNAMSVRMQTALWPKGKTTMFGMKGRTGTTYKMEIETKELDEYTFNKVLYSMAMGMDPMQRMVFVKQGLTGDKPLFTRRWGIEFLNIVDHPDEMLKEIDIEQEKVISQQIRLRQAATGEGGGGGAPPQAPGTVEGGGGAPAPLVTPGAAPTAGTPPLPLNVAMGRPAPEGEGAPTSTSAPPAGGAPGSAPMPKLNPLAPPTTEVGPHKLGLTAPLIGQVTSVVQGLALKGAVWAIVQGDRVRLTCEFYQDAKKVHVAVDSLYGKRVSVRSSKVQPPGSNDITQGAAPTATPPTGGMS